jgi:TonB family protein
MMDREWVEGDTQMAVTYGPLHIVGGWLAWSVPAEIALFATAAARASGEPQLAAATAMPRASCSWARRAPVCAHCQRPGTQMGASGTAVIEIVVAPSGAVISARVYKSSGVPLIDATALEHARDAHLPPFNDEMPNQPHAFLVPITIQPSPND